MRFAMRPYTTQHWRVTKPAARGRRGIVASQAREAAEAGVAVLESGGNAVDAALAAAFALAAVEPWSTGLAGVGYALVHMPGAPCAEVVDFGPMAPRALDPARFHLTGRPAADMFAWPEVEGDVNLQGPLSFLVPAAVAGYATLHERWGRMPRGEVMAPAIALARRGLPADWFTTLRIANSAAFLRLYPESARIYLADGLPPVPPYQGKTGFLHLGELADTLERLSRAGLRDFYEGDVAESIVRDVAAMDGFLNAEDLRSCQAECRPAMRLRWRQDCTLELPGGLNASPTFAAVLERFHPCAREGEPDGPWYAALAEAIKAAYAIRFAKLGAMEPVGPEGCTTHISACDAEGGMVALTSTLLSSMGSRVVLPGTGVLMNNGVMWFDPRPGRPNSLAPGKRPLCNMCPAILCDGERPWLAGGASGGRHILAAMLQMFSFVADFGMDPEAAAHHPRIDVSSAERVAADRRLAPDVMAALEALGPLETLEHAVLPVNFACPNLIESRRDGSRVGVSDVMSPWSAALAEQPSGTARAEAESDR